MPKYANAWRYFNKSKMQECKSKMSRKIQSITCIGSLSRNRKLFTPVCTDMKYVDQVTFNLRFVAFPFFDLFSTFTCRNAVFRTVSRNGEAVISWTITT